MAGTIQDTDPTEKSIDCIFGLGSFLKAALLCGEADP
jgi:hypothetical protein